MLGNLRKGDSVITGGGLYGRITGISDDVINLDLGNNMEVKVHRGYISTVVKNDTTETDKKDRKGKQAPKKSE